MAVGNSRKLGMHKLQQTTLRDISRLVSKNRTPVSFFISIFRGFEYSAYSVRRHRSGCGRINIQVSNFHMLELFFFTVILKSENCVQECDPDEQMVTILKWKLPTFKQHTRATGVS